MNARKFVLKALIEICMNHAYANLYLKKHLDEVDKKQQAFCSALIYGTLQYDRYLQYQYEDLIQGNSKKELMILLNMSIYELFFMNEKEYAVVNEAVNLANSYGKKSKGFVNAILHKVIKRGKRALPENEDEALSIETSHPLWLVKMWNAQYGKDICKKICYENMKVKPLCVRVNTLKTSREKLGDDFIACKGSKDGAIFVGKNLFEHPAFLNNEVMVQDESSQMVALFLDPKQDDVILDTCSAPGSKAIHMTQIMKDKGKIVCGDIHASRVDLIKEQALKQGLKSIEAKVMDATINDSDILYDKILCDVPCSGYGVLGNKSDIKYRMQSSDMDTLIPLQYQILEASCKKLKDDGILVYSTCTLNKKENEKQIEKFLKNHDEFMLVDMKTIFPFDYQSDGFFMAKLKKRI